METTKQKNYQSFLFSTHRDHAVLNKVSDCHGKFSSHNSNDQRRFHQELGLAEGIGRDFRGRARQSGPEGGIWGLRGHRAVAGSGAVRICQTLYAAAGL